MFFIITYFQFITSATPPALSFQLAREHFWSPGYGLWPWKDIELKRKLMWTKLSPSMHASLFKTGAKSQKHGLPGWKGTSRAMLFGNASQASMAIQPWAFAACSCSHFSIWRTPAIQHKSQGTSQALGAPQKVISMLAGAADKNRRFPHPTLRNSGSGQREGRRGEPGRGSSDNQQLRTHQAPCL